MSRYIEKDLGQYEWIVQKATMHWAYFLPDILFCFILIGFITLPISLLKRWGTELAFTNKRLLGKVGVFNIDELDIPLNRVSDIKIKSNLIGKLCGFGTIIITMGTRRMRFVAVRQPEKFKNALREQAEKYQLEQYHQPIATNNPWVTQYPQNPVWENYPNYYSQQQQTNYYYPQQS